MALALLRTRLRFLQTVSSFRSYSDFTFDPNPFYASLIHNSLHKSHLHQIHAQSILSQLLSSGFLISKLIHCSANFGEISYARNLFDHFPQPDVFLWNAIIRCYSKHALFRDTIDIYRKMQIESVPPDAFTLPPVLKACSSLMTLHTGRQVHAQVFRFGYEADVFVQNALVAFYAKCGRISSANSVFDRLISRTTVSWTSIISGYAQNGQPIEALRIFSQMRKTNVKLDWVSLVSVLRAYTDIDDLKHGQSIHSCVLKLGLEHEIDLIVSLTAMYAKCGEVLLARRFFDQVEKPNLILWNAMISGYMKNGYAEEALRLFRKMIDNNFRPDSITVTSSILACGQMGSLELAKWMSCYINRSEFRDDAFVSSALVDMFSKCGSVDLAHSVFNRAQEKDVVLWSSMIMGYGLHGCGREAIDLFSEMKQAGVRPNDVTFIGLLTACKNSGLVEEGWRFFNSMRDYGIEPRHQHYACVVDLLARKGHIDRAYDYINKMPIEPEVSIWGALLTACKIHRNVEIGEDAAKKLFRLDPFNTGHYVQLSNLYASACLWDKVGKLRVVMKKKGLSKDIGHSVIEINGKLHVFQFGNKSHPKYDEIYAEMCNLERRLKETGFVPMKESVLHDLDDEEIEETLFNHSERLAIAYGLISTPSGATLRVTKNLRACENCHEATKHISKLVNREIVVRDANRFHHFKDGVCSCGDYW